MPSSEDLLSWWASRVCSPWSIGSTSSLTLGYFEWLQVTSLTGIFMSTYWKFYAFLSYSWILSWSIYLLACSFYRCLSSWLNRLAISVCFSFDKPSLINFVNIFGLWQDLRCDNYFSTISSWHSIGKRLRDSWDSSLCAKCALGSFGCKLL